MCILKDYMFDFKTLFEPKPELLTGLSLDAYGPQLPGIIDVTEPYFAVDITEREVKTSEQFEAIASEIWEGLSLGNIEEIDLPLPAAMLKPARRIAITALSQDIVNATIELDCSAYDKVYLVGATLNSDREHFAKHNIPRPQVDFVFSLIGIKDSKVRLMLSFN